MRSGDKKTVAVLFMLALFIRLAALMVVPSPPIDDSAQAAYLAGAHKLIAGEGFRDPSYPVDAPPLYGMFIALCESILGDNLRAVKVVQGMVDSVTVVLSFLIMRELFNVRTGLLAAAILSVYPFSIYLAISIASEPLVTCLLACFVLITIHAVRLQRVRYFVGAGIVLALATLTRGTTQFLPFLFFLVLLPFMHSGKQLLLTYMAFLVSFIIVISPWTIRNYIVLDDIIPVATSGGIVILMGSKENYLTIAGKPGMFETHPPPQGSKPSELDRHWRNAGLAEHLKHLRTDPVGFITFNVKKFFRLWYATESGKNHQLILGLNLPLYGLACIGLMIVFRKGQNLILIPMFVVTYFALLHWASLPLFRYTIPVMPYVIGLAAFAILELADQWGILERFHTTVSISGVHHKKSI